MRLLPFDFTVKYVPGSRMGITDYLSRDPTFEAFPAEDESELVIAIIRRLSQQKNMNYLKTANQIMNSAAQKKNLSHTRPTENKRKPLSGPPQVSESQTRRSRREEQRKQRHEATEIVMQVKSAINRPIRSENDKRKLLQTRNSIQNTIDLSRSQSSASASKLNSQFHKRQNLSLKNFNSVTTKHYRKMNSHTESLQSNVITDLDAHISITQARIDHLKKAGGLQFVGTRAEVYRPNKEARQELRELTDRLELLYETRRKAKPVTKPQPVQPYRKRAPLHVTSITARQNSSNVETEEEVSTTLARVLFIAEQTGINLKKWIEETDRDPELNLLRQALLDKNTKQIPASFKLYQNELRVNMRLIFVEDKIVVPPNTARVGHAGGS